ncbi:MAG: cyclic nucleotide-binding domain-containing protein [Bacteroidota bacterium]|jgi:CRP-like cAMP-binding protein|nr:cyclic nucleotide-binding domain-containing protein [Bacteroidota bacterium]
MINPFKKTYTLSQINIFRFLAKIRLFETLSHEEMAYFLPYLYLRTYKEGEAIFFRNDPSHALYIIKKGVITLNIDIKDKFEVLGILKTGSAFGDNSLLRNSRRIYSAITESEMAELYVVPQVNILEIFSLHPLIKAKMLNSLAEIYNDYTVNLFKAYKSSFGFFNLGEAYLNSEKTN